MIELRMNRFTFALLASVALAVVGCGDGGPEVAEVQGTVTLGGKPLQGIVVILQPSSGRPSDGITNAEGKYELFFKRGKPGAQLGMHSIRVQGMDPPIPDASDFDEDEQYEQVVIEQQEKHPIPRQYRDGSMKIEVKPGMNTFDFTM
ncbi:MAG: hypothetical protein KDB01_02565 [Planctomycetaceae bacterium]|nr:hypothetical protein [Planctomycetaceae bacterium]